MKKVKISWKDLKIGDKFPDGSIVKEIKPWDYKVCYEIEILNGKIIASDTHLFKCKITNELNETINETFSLSKNSRIYAGVSPDDDIWICAEDIYNSSLNKNLVINFLDHNDGVMPLVTISLFKNGEPQIVRCITTNYGSYQVNGFINHNCGSSEVTEQQNDSAIIMGTLDGWSTSPIIQKMKECETTEEMRETLYKGLKDLYKKANIKQDDFNLQIVAKKLTSYKRTVHGLEPVNDGGKADIVSMGTVGNSNNIFKISELSSGYKHLTKPMEQKLETDAANQILK